MKIAIGSDHGGFDLKSEILNLVTDLGFDVVDAGCYSSASVDYPEFANVVCDKVIHQECDRGILICGTGIGMSIVANRSTKIRAALCHDEFTSRMSREHNDANVLCLGARVIGPGVAAEIVRVWLATEFSGGRHVQRIKQFSE